MSFLRQIQESIIREDVDLSSVLLKLRLLASRLGSGLLEEWVEHESEGYPEEVDVPPYRKVGVTYTGTFFGQYSPGIKNAPIPPAVIKKLAGEHWVKYEVRGNIAEVMEAAKAGSTPEIDASDLILILGNRIYPNLSCGGIIGEMSRSHFVGILQALRTRILELTIELERNIPEVTDISFETGQKTNIDPDNKMPTIVQQIIHGGNGNAVMATGNENTQIELNVSKNDTESLLRCLTAMGIPEKDANELAEIVQSEKPINQNEPLGERAKSWMAKNIGKAGKEVWNIGKSVATKVITDALARYYGLG